MIELALKTALERLTGLDVYPLLLPDELQEGITYQCISDPELYTGLLRTGLIAGRFQIAIHLTFVFSALVMAYTDKVMNSTLVLAKQLEH